MLADAIPARFSPVAWTPMPSILKAPYGADLLGDIPRPTGTSLNAVRKKKKQQREAKKRNRKR